MKTDLKPGDFYIDHLNHTGGIITNYGKVEGISVAFGVPQEESNVLIGKEVKLNISVKEYSNSTIDKNHISKIDKEEFINSLRELFDNCIKIFEEK